MRLESRMRNLLIAVTTTAVLQAISQEAAPPQQIAFARLFPNGGQLGVFIAAADGSDVASPASGHRPRLQPHLVA